MPPMHVMTPCRYDTKLMQISQPAGHNAYELEMRYANADRAKYL
jgi:hypothetical protein